MKFNADFLPFFVLMDGASIIMQKYLVEKKVKYKLSKNLGEVLWFLPKVKGKLVSLKNYTAMYIEFL